MNYWQGFRFGLVITTLVMIAWAVPAASITHTCTVLKVNTATDIDLVCSYDGREKNIFKSVISYEWSDKPENEYAVIRNLKFKSKWIKKSDETSGEKEFVKELVDIGNKIITWTTELNYEKDDIGKEIEIVATDKNSTRVTLNIKEKPVQTEEELPMPTEIDSHWEDEEASAEMCIKEIKNKYKGANSGKASFLCLEEKDESLIVRMSPNMMETNRILYAAIIHDEKLEASMKLIAGEEGKSASSNRGEEEMGPHAGGPAGKTGKIISPYEFGPFLPDKATIEATISSGDETKDTTQVTILINKTYAGAFRLGVATIFGEVVPQLYEGRTRPGSKQREVATFDRDFPGVFEFVVGYTVYLPPHRPEVNLWPTWHFAGIYFGMGVLQLDPQSEQKALDFLKSLHVGIEFELNANAAIAFTALASRINILDSKEGVGTPLGDSEEPHMTSDLRLGYGFGIVVNFGPKVFRTLKNGGN